MIYGALFFWACLIHALITRKAFMGIFFWWEPKWFIRKSGESLKYCMYTISFAIFAVIFTFAS